MAALSHARRGRSAVESRAMDEWLAGSLGRVVGVVPQGKQPWTKIRQGVHTRYLYTAQAVALPLVAYYMHVSSILGEWKRAMTADPASLTADLTSRASPTAGGQACRSVLYCAPRPVCPWWIGSHRLYPLTEHICSTPERHSPECSASLPAGLVLHGRNSHWPRASSLRIDISLSGGR